MSSPCPCDTPEPRQLEIAAGLDALPRQTQTFVVVRDALLRSVSGKDALAGWRSRSGRDLGLMWLEMWAYVSDVLGFYDERIANESYLRTAQLRPSLRRIVELLGYVPTPGLAGSATVAAIADGRAGVTLPAGTAFRSDAFGDQAPQVFETGAPDVIHPLKNEWRIGPLKNDSVRQSSPSQAPGQRAFRARVGRFFVFDAASFNLAKDRLALFELSDGSRHVTRVVNVLPFVGKDGQSYVEVEVSPRLAFSSSLTVDQVRVRTPTISAVVTKHRTAQSVESPEAGRPSRITPHTVYLDAIYRQIRVFDPVIASIDSPSIYQVNVVTDIQEEAVELELQPDQVSTIPVTRLIFKSAHRREIRRSPKQATYHFGFVDAGALAAVADTGLSQDDLSRTGGVPVSGFVETPPDALRNELKQPFLLVDADGKGALVDGRLRFDGAGRASFQVADGTGLQDDVYKTPISIFGNLLETTRGESVFNEVLGSGDPRQVNQRFTLKRKPLTYVETPSNALGYKSTLSLSVSGQLWEEVKNFFGLGPSDQVYTVRHDDDQNTIITFGDGVQGARVPAGQNNVVATYRTGSGLAAPPANAIQQVARSVLGLRSVRSPVAAEAGRDSDSPLMLRTLAPRSALSFKRAVSVADFEAFAMSHKGVVKAVAEYVWLAGEQRAGVRVTYIGDISEEALRRFLIDRGEEGLPLQVNQAIGRRSSIALDLAYDRRFDRRAVERAVRRALTDADRGVLSVAKQEIGGPLWASRIFEQVQSVEGVVGVQNVVIKVRALSSEGVLIEGQALSPLALRRLLAARGPIRQHQLGRESVVCTPGGTFFDFAENSVSVRSRTKVSVLTQLPRHMEEI